MTPWQYVAIDLSDGSAKQTEIERLDILEAQGCELIAVLAPHRAVFKKPSELSRSCRHKGAYQ